MKNFEVEVIKNGRRQKMVLKADNRNAAKNLAMKKTNGVITKIGETQNVSNSFSDILVKVTRGNAVGKIKIPNLVAATKQLAVMTSAGISIHDSIKEVANASEDGSLKQIFGVMNEDLNAVLSLT